jgi:hypothetical protein
MNIKDLYTQWETDVQHALAAQLSQPDPQPDDLLQAAGLNVRTGVPAGFGYNPKMTIYSTCGANCK